MPKQDKTTINGTEFVFQHPGVRWYIKLTDRCRQNQFGSFENEKYQDELLENVVIKPNDVNSLDNFGPDKDYSAATLQELMQEIESFLES